MFQTLAKLPADPILGLNQAFHQDDNPRKINLSVGVYQDASGNTPIFSAVKRAEQRLIAEQNSKSYISQLGDAAFLGGMSDLLLGHDLVSNLGDRLATVMTPGGCGALRMGAEILADAKDQPMLWVSDPTWANHYPLLESAGLTLSTYAYYDVEIKGVDFAAMLRSLKAIPRGDMILLHGCCHNPTGADLTAAQWDQVVDILVERDLLPFIDVAYQGFGDGLDPDAYGVRRTVEKCSEVLIAVSCSKNFGLYRERTGAVMVISQDPKQTAAACSHITSAARRSYSMSPYHGGGIVGLILGDADLIVEWKSELEQVRNRMNQLRVELASGLNQAQSKINFDFVARSKGMFCFFGISREHVLTLRSEFGIYLLENTRINVAGLSEDNIPVIVERVADVVSR